MAPCAIASARTTRAKRVQSMTTMARMIDHRPGPSTAMSRIENSTGGKAIQISISREISRSTQPRRNPASRPSVAPITQVIAPAISATLSATRAPWMMRDSTSRPSESVPSQ